MTNRTIHTRFTRLPSGLACYPRVLFTARPDLLKVVEPPAFEVRVDHVRIDPAHVARYAAVCGFGAQDVRNGYVPITYPHVLAMPLHLRIMAMPSFPLRPMGLIHLTNTISLPGELRIDAPLDVLVKARNYHKTDAGLAFDMDTELTQAGEPVWRETCTFLSRWPESVQRVGGRPPRPPKAPRDSTVLAEIEATAQIAWSYARVSNDYNPIHLSHRAARFFGLRGAISHGMWSLARSLADQPADTPRSNSRLDTQFLTPVQLPARVNVKRWSEQGVLKRAMCDARTGRVHMYAYWNA